jgi:hypothetical protein
MPLLTLIDLAQLQEDDREEYVEGLLYEGQICVMVAMQKAGKSYFCTQLAVSLAAGVNFMGDNMRIPKAVNVLYWQTEGTKHDLAERSNPIFELLPDAVDRFFAEIPETLDLKGGEGIPELVAAIEDSEAQVVIIDSLFSSMQGDINKSEHVQQVKAQLNKIRFRFPKVAFIILHHEHRQIRAKDGEIIEEGKNAYAGSYVVAAMADIFWLFTVEANGMGERRTFAPAYTRSRFAGGDPFDVTLDLEIGLLKAETVSLSNIIYAVETYFRGHSPLKRTDWHTWADGRDIPRSSKFRYIKDMKKKKQIKEIELKGVVYYQWTGGK